MQVDIMDFTLKRWVAGNVIKIEDGKIKVSIEGYPD
jgi:hypothetical protein